MPPLSGSSVEAEADALRAGKSRKEAIYAAYDRFYKGDIAEEIVRSVREQGGLFTREDLANWKVKVEEPTQTNYKGIDLYKLQPWTQGPAMLQALNILENFDLQAMGGGGAQHEQLPIDALASDTTLDHHEKESRAAVALGRSGFLDRTVRSEVLSGGWRKRLAIATGLARDPDVLLMDEPTNHLDVEGILCSKGCSGASRRRSWSSATTAIFSRTSAGGCSSSTAAIPRGFSKPRGATARFSAGCRAMIATGDKELLRLEEVRLGGCPGAEPSEPVSFS